MQAKQMPPLRRDDRVSMSSLGEYYEDLLEIDAQINARSKAEQARTLIYAKVQEREIRIKERVQYLAEKRGISFKQMWDSLLTGEYEKLTPGEYAELRKKLPTRDDETETPLPATATGGKSVSDKSKG